MSSPDVGLSGKFSGECSDENERGARVNKNTAYSVKNFSFFIFISGLEL